MYSPCPRTSVPRPLLGHLCQDLGVLRRPREAGAAELGGSVLFRLHIGLRLKTKLSDFRTFHSSKNNCTWGKKHADTSQSHLVASTMCQRLLELTGSVCHAPNAPTPASLISRSSRSLCVPKPRYRKDSKQAGRHGAALAWPYYVTASKNLAQNSWVPHAKSKVTEAGAGRWGPHSIASDCTQGSPRWPLHPAIPATYKRHVSAVQMEVSLIGGSLPFLGRNAIGFCQGSASSAAI